MFTTVYTSELQCRTTAIVAIMILITNTVRVRTDVQMITVEILLELRIEGMLHLSLPIYEKRRLSVQTSL